MVKPLPSEIRAVAAEEVLLPCEAVGIPLPTISWQKEGLSIPVGECDRGPGVLSQLSLCQPSQSTPLNIP